jgi:hypothetical protein
LKRTVNGQFHLNESITLDKLREIKDNVGGAFVPIDSVEFNVTTVFVSDGDVSYLKMGTCVSYDFGDEFSDHGVALARSPSGLVVSEIDLGRNVLRPRKVIF